MHCSLRTHVLPTEKTQYLNLALPVWGMIRLRLEWKVTEFSHKNCGQMRTVEIENLGPIHVTSDGRDGE